MSSRVLRTYWFMSAFLTIQIALATQFVYLPACAPSAQPVEVFPDVVAEMGQFDLMPR
jgi:hypothetical protein